MKTTVTGVEMFKKILDQGQVIDCCFYLALMFFFFLNKKMHIQKDNERSKLEDYKPPKLDFGSI